MNSREIIRQVIGKVFERYGVQATFSLDVPEMMEHGDYATNVAFFLSKIEKTKPIECAKNLVPELQGPLKDIVQKVEVAGPGFINFYLRKEAVRHDINILEKLETFTTKYTGKKVLVEHSSPNLFKPFGVGLLLNNVAGESLVHLMKAGGAEVSTVSFPSDISVGIAKAIYIIKKDGGLSQDIFRKSQEEVVSYLGKAYARGVAYFDDNISAKEEIREVARKLYESSPSEEFDIFRKSKEINIAYFEMMISGLGSHFDGFIYESEVADIGKKIVLTNVESVFTRSEGAIVYFPDEGKKGVHTAVFLNSQGYPTYEAKDLGLLKLKFKKYNPDYSFFVTDSEQISHFNVVLDAASKIEKIWAERSNHVLHGRMTFKGKKISARFGNVPLAKDIVNLLTEEVAGQSGVKIADFKDEERKILYKQVALAAVRFSMLRSKLGSNMNFDPETSLSFLGDSGPYVQYTHARAKSLISKGAEFGFIPMYDNNQEVTNIERKLIQFENVAIRAIEEVAPQYVVTYLFELTQMFNSFYSSTPVVTEGDIKTSHRLAIVQSVATIIRKALYLLAVDAPERM